MPRFRGKNMNQNQKQNTNAKACSPRAFGTKEWAQRNVNCLSGCSHRCWYCYAMAGAIRFKRKTPATWKEEEFVGVKAVGGKPCRVMFPTTHDITPDTLHLCTEQIRNILAGGHEILIVSKPHLECIKAICEALKGFEKQILFRFTIGTLDAKIAKMWEPGAPAPKERTACLKYAKSHGFRTSVSMEPMLLGTEDAIKTFHKLLPLVTETIWIGKMNRKSVFRAAAGIKVACRYVRELQSNRAILELVSHLGSQPQVRWKDSIRKVIRAHVSGPGTESSAIKKG